MSRERKDQAGLRHPSIAYKVLSVTQDKLHLHITDHQDKYKWSQFHVYWEVDGQHKALTSFPPGHVIWKTRFRPSSNIFTIII